MDEYFEKMRNIKMDTEISYEEFADYYTRFMEV